MGDDLSIFMETNIFFGDNAENIKKIKGRKISKKQFQAVSVNNGVQKEMKAKNKLLRKRKIDENCRKLKTKSIENDLNQYETTNNYKYQREIGMIMDETHKDIQRAHQMRLENMKLQNEIEAIKFSIYQRRAHYHAPLRQIVPAAPYPDYFNDDYSNYAEYAAMDHIDEFQNHAPIEIDSYSKSYQNSAMEESAFTELMPNIDAQHENDEKLLFPDGTMLIEDNKKRDDISNSSMSTPLIQPFGGGYNQNMTSFNIESSNPLMQNESVYPPFNASIESPQPLNLNSAFINYQN